MVLQSQLFRGDPKLEAAASADRDHIVPGSSGPHVGKIQLALSLIDGATIAQQEIASGLYGATTAQSVLAYKQKRKIINTSYQSQADDIVGKMTIASLDHEMAQRPSILYRCGCHYVPVAARQRIQPAFLADLHPLAPTAGPQSLLAKAFAAVPTAIEMRNKAKDALTALIDGSPAAAATLCTQALGTHYKVTAKQDVINTARAVRNSLAQIAGRLASARAWLREDSSRDGFADTPQPRDGHSYILRGYAQAGDLLRPVILIHEAFHDLDAFNDDFGGNPARDQGAAYHQNSTAIQLQNAYAMSQFVLHIWVGQERILNDNE